MLPAAYCPPGLLPSMCAPLAEGIVTTHTPAMGTAEEEETSMDAAPYTTDEILQGIAILEANLAEDNEASSALRGQDDTETARAMFALTAHVMFKHVQNDMWVVKNGIPYDDIEDVPELKLARFVALWTQGAGDFVTDHPFVATLLSAQTFLLISEMFDKEAEEMGEVLAALRAEVLTGLD